MGEGDMAQEVAEPDIPAVVGYQSHVLRSSALVPFFLPPRPSCFLLLPIYVQWVYLYKS